MVKAKHQSQKSSASNALKKAIEKDPNRPNFEPWMGEIIDSQIDNIVSSLI